MDVVAFCILPDASTRAISSRTRCGDLYYIPLVCFDNVLYFLARSCFESYSGQRLVPTILYAQCRCVATVNTALHYIVNDV